jgi:predicted RNA binding protein YcfA (HicA-like mRNA interferase family)
LFPSGIKGKNRLIFLICQSRINNKKIIGFSLSLENPTINTLMKVIKVGEIIRRLNKDGWYIYRYKGTSHRQFKHPVKKGKVTVNGKHSSDISGSLLKSIENQSGLIF